MGDKKDRRRKKHKKKGSPRSATYPVTTARGGTVEFADVTDDDDLLACKSRPVRDSVRRDPSRGDRV